MEKLDSYYSVKITIGLHERIVKLSLIDRQMIAHKVRQLLDNLSGGVESGHAESGMSVSGKSRDVP
jgi:hypothetical protein